MDTGQVWITWIRGRTRLEYLDKELERFLMICGWIRFDDLDKELDKVR